jgi:hypothetical protein
LAPRGALLIADLDRRPQRGELVISTGALPRELRRYPGSPAEERPGVSGEVAEAVAVVVGIIPILADD